MPLSDRETRKAMRLSLVEGVFFALMVGFGETYFVADGVRLGGTPVQLGLLVTLPLFLGAGGSLAAIALLTRIRRRRILVAGAAFLQAMTFLGLLLFEMKGRLTPEILLVLACLHQVCGLAAGTAWSSWYGDLVPAEVRGRYFARRTRGVHLATCAGLYLGGLLLQTLEPGAAGTVRPGQGGQGFLILFALAGSVRLVSAIILAVSPEPPFRGVTDVPATLRFTATARGKSALRVLTAGTALQLMVCVSSPYFTPFMLEQLHFTYTEYMAAAMALAILKFVALPGWGRTLDQQGARSVYTLCALLVALVPLPWFWCNGLLSVLAAQSLSGFSWAGYEVSFFALLLESSTSRVRPHLFAAHNLLTGTAQLLGGLLGVVLLGAFEGSYRMVFAASMAGRILIAAAVPSALPAEIGTQRVGRGHLILRVIGFRPHGGVVHRPIDPGDEKEMRSTREG